MWDGLAPYLRGIDGVVSFAPRVRELLALSGFPFG
jgi:hypothetical protein